MMDKLHADEPDQAPLTREAGKTCASLLMVYSPNFTTGVKRGRASLKVYVVGSGEDKSAESANETLVDDPSAEDFAEPPSWSVWLLSRILKGHKHVVEYEVGDLLENYSERVRERGRGAANRWFYRTLVTETWSRLSEQTPTIAGVLYIVNYVWSAIKGIF